ncbi:head maturation protease, ClpP-related [Roseibium alexandrii]|uniref:head maturation protease, ClpP-related n=1 Tax=Roseibium alexandrii TaxID=388408 RepID=UPI003750E48E
MPTQYRAIRTARRQIRALGQIRNIKMPVYVNGELVLYGFVGDDFWREGFTSTEVLEALAEHGTENDLPVRLNSGGGLAFEGLAIYNALQAHQGKVTIIVDAIAASAASIIAMAGDEIIMRAGSEMMIHDPSGVTFGTADDHEKAKSALDKLGSQMASIYAARSDNSAEDVRQTMKDETWLIADEAIEAGYADRAEEAKAKPVSAFDYRVYSKAPDRLVALSNEKGWSLPTAVSRSAASAAPTGQQETIMPDKTKADENAAETDKLKADVAAETKARIKAITGLEEAKGLGALANHIAFNTETDVEAAKATLAAARNDLGSSEEGQQEAGQQDTETNPTAYEQQRLLASSQALPGGSPSTVKAEVKPGAIYAARRKSLKEA